MLSDIKEKLVPISDKMSDHVPGIPTYFSDIGVMSTDQRGKSQCASLEPDIFEVPWYTCNLNLSLTCYGQVQAL